MSNSEPDILSRQGRRYHTGFEDPYAQANRGISAFLDSLKPKLMKRKMVDIGAGEIPFKEYYQNLSVTFSDIQQNKSGTIDILLPKNGPLPMQDLEYGGVFLFDVLEHVKDDVFFVRECYRILSQGGLVVATVPFLYRFHEEPHDFRRYTPSGLEYLFREIGGFSKVEIRPYGNPATICKTVLAESGIPRVGIWHRILFKGIYTLLDLASGRNGLYGENLSSGTASGYFVVAEKG